LAKKFTNPPVGVPEVFAATMYILAGFWNEVIEVDAKKKPKSSDWKSCVKMMGNPIDFLNKLLGFKEVVD